MIIVMQPDAGDAEIDAVEAKIRAHGLAVHISRGTERTLIGAIGDERALEPEMFDPMPGVEKSMHIVKQYKMVAREWHKENTVVLAGGVPIGGSTVQVIGAPHRLQRGFNYARALLRSASSHAVLIACAPLWANENHTCTSQVLAAHTQE